MIRRPGRLAALVVVCLAVGLGALALHVHDDDALSGRHCRLCDRGDGVQTRQAGDLGLPLTSRLGALEPTAIRSLLAYDPAGASQRRAPPAYLRRPDTLD